MTFKSLHVKKVENGFTITILGEEDGNQGALVYIARTVEELCTVIADNLVDEKPEAPKVEAPAAELPESD